MSPLFYFGGEEGDDGAENSDEAERDTEVGGLGDKTNKGRAEQEAQVADGGDGCKGDARGQYAGPAGGAIDQRNDGGYAGADEEKADGGGNQPGEGDRDNET